MIRLLLRRLAQGLLVVFVLETITFFLVRLLPGNPFLGDRKLPEHIMAQLNNLYGLDQPAWVQYLNYWKGILLHGDFGPSLVREGVQVSTIISQAFPVSLEVGVVGMLIAVCVGGYLHSGLCHRAGVWSGAGHTCAGAERGRVG